MTVISKYTGELGMRLAHGMDAVISEAVTRAHGSAGWTFEDFRNRARLVRIADDTFQTLFLDEKPILELHDPTFETERRDQSWHIVVKQNYRFLTPEFSVPKEQPHEPD